MFVGNMESNVCGKHGIKCLPAKLFNFFLCSNFELLLGPYVTKDAQNVLVLNNLRSPISYELKKNEKINVIKINQFSV